jgi:hypothetical protein
MLLTERIGRKADPVGEVPCSLTIWKKHNNVDAKVNLIVEPM